MRVMKLVSQKVKCFCFLIATNIPTLRQVLHVAYVLVFWSCYNKVPQNTTTETYLLSYCFGGQSPKSSCQQDHTPSKDSREQGKNPSLPVSLLLVPAGNLWFLVLKPCHSNLPPSLSGLLPGVSSHHLLIRSVLIRTLVIGIRAHPNPG